MAMLGTGAVAFALVVAWLLPQCPADAQGSAVVAVEQGKAGEKVSTFSPVVPTRRAVTVTVGRRGEIRVEGKPFLPIFVWLQPIRNFDFLKSLGINTFMGEGAGDETTQQFLDALKERGLWGVVHARPENFSLRNHPALLTWMFSDEPDLPAQMPYERPVTVPKDAQGNINIWWEGEKPEKTNFRTNEWMDREVSKHLLSGEGWLSTDADQPPPEGGFQALYHIEVPQTARYTLWVREFTKAWASPTWWRFDAGVWQHTPRDLKSVELQRVGRVLTVGWHRYGTVELAAGRHTFEIKVDEKRTAGTPDKVADNLMVAFDAFLLTTSDQAPIAPARPPRPRLAPEEIARQYASLKQVDTSHPIYLNLTARFLPEQRSFAPFYTDELYRGYARATDIIGYDLYPITGWGKPEYIPMIASATKKLRELAPEHVPVWVILECTTKLQWVSQERLNQIGRPQGAKATDLRAMVWMALINGAKGIGYFPHRWDPYKQCDISEELQAEMKRTNRQLTELAPVILGEDAEGIVTLERIEGGPVEFAVKKAESGAIPHLFLVNVGTVPARVRLRLSGAKAMLDLDSGEMTPVGAEGITLAFEPLQVRLFVLK